jgi:hypothetical protein
MSKMDLVAHFNDTLQAPLNTYNNYNRDFCMPMETLYYWVLSNRMASVRETRRTNLSRTPLTCGGINEAELRTGQRHVAKS